MFLLEPNQTAYDLRWRMFGIDVRVHPMFWVVGLVMGWDARDQGFSYVLLWVVCVFISILIHELGHVVMGLMFGFRGHIVLYYFGGLAIGSNGMRNRWQRIAVSFAGPLAGFLFLAVLLILFRVVEPPRADALWTEIKNVLGMKQPIGEKYHPSTSLVNSALWFFVLINLFWGLVNLLPVLPLDGGQISRDLCEGAMPGRGTRFSLGLSMVVAGAVCLYAILAENDRKLPSAGGWWTAFFFGVLALGNFMQLQQQSPPSRGGWSDERAPWERDPDYWKR